MPDQHTVLEALTENNKLLSQLLEETRSEDTAKAAYWATSDEDCRIN